ncbi:DNA-binding transcriptional regulator, LysR family [Formivibrio citricus]|uniref:DNA-binding transcriptional regulator, LysR family n=2 Tax=Formivibrio citricus TaxID=83765 RepID=A0A1I5BB98_9NEIS|nr:DNA-binding transcriptional regulator, LysR family [Formivibrio citricus]
MRLNQLEKELGVRLLNRSTRQLSLTHEGEVYFSRGSALLADLADLNREVSSGSQTPKGLLKINAPMVLGRQKIAPIVYEYMERHPEIKIQLDLTSEPANQIEQGYDVSIRVGLPPDSRLVARKLASNRRYLCASPLYLDKFGMPSHPKELVKHECLILKRPEDANIWRLSKDNLIESIKVQGHFSSTDGEVLMGWALRGRGIVSAGDWYIHKYLKSGRMRHVLEEWSPPNWDIYAIYPEKIHLPAKVASFIDFLADKINMLQQK